MKPIRTNRSARREVKSNVCQRRLNASRRRTRIRRRGAPEIRLHRILVPVDLTACSRNALEYAALLAGLRNATITLLYVVDPDCACSESNALASPLSEARMLAQVRKQLDTLAEQTLRGRGRCETLVRFGSPPIEIEEVARERGIDLIVAATHGERGLPDFCFASTTEKMLRHTPCPVLIVREREHDLCERNPQPSRPKGNL
jgi:nucleotide-binding universal stress UspA family protein